MADQVTVLVCADAVKAEAARIFLQSPPLSYPASGITSEQVKVFNYDAQTFGAGGTADVAHDKFVVTGRK